MFQGVTMVKVFKKLEFILSIRTIYCQTDQFYGDPNVIAMEAMMGHMCPDRQFKTHKKLFFFEENRTKFLSKMLQEIDVYMFSVMSVNFNNVIRVIR